MHRVIKQYNEAGVVVELGDVMLLMPEVLGLHPDQTPSKERVQERAQEKLRKLNMYTPDPRSFLIQAYMKSGTHWLWEIMRMLIAGEAEVCKQMKEEYFLEMQDVDRIPISSTAIIYNTHIPPSVTPPGFTELKTVYILRNPKDVMVSSYHHVKSLQMADGFNWDSFYQEFITMGTESSARLGDDFFNFTKEVWATRDDPNVLLLFYEDLVQDFTTQLTKLAKFMEVPVVDGLIGEIQRSTEIKSLKATKQKLMKGDEFGIHLTKLYRKGGVGNWKSYFSEDQNEAFDRVLAANFMDCDGLRFTYELP